MNARKTKNHGLVEVGDILVSCFGYEAEIYNFYEVVGVTRAMVKIRELRTKIAGETNFPMYYGRLIEPVTEGEDRFIGDVMLRKPRYWNNRDGITISVDIDSVRTAHYWDGEPCDEYNAH